MERVGEFRRAAPGLGGFGCDDERRRNWWTPPSPNSFGGRLPLWGRSLSSGGRGGRRK